MRTCFCRMRDRRSALCISSHDVREVLFLVMRQIVVARGLWSSTHRCAHALASDLKHKDVREAWRGSVGLSQQNNAPRLPFPAAA